MNKSYQLEVWIYDQLVHTEWFKDKEEALHEALLYKDPDDTLIWTVVTEVEDDG